MRLVLASASPRRAELLRAAGFSFETLIVGVDERVRKGEAPAEYVQRLAREKSAKGLARLRRRPVRAGRYAGRTSVSRTNELVVLGADTAVVVDDEILGKPRGQADARAMLRRLSGRRHDVLTGISVRSAAAEVGHVETTSVYFTELGDDEVEWYVASGEGSDKAGAYAIQGLASRFVPRIEGSYSNVVGLPVARVHELVRKLASHS
jgi:septum formation protein